MVKIERVPGALATERVALEWVSAHDGPAPCVLARSTVALADDRRAQCLVIEHVDGHAPDTDDGGSDWAKRLHRSLNSQPTTVL